MPPSPALRCSPGREPRSDPHKRGRSLESGLSFKGKDDGLALFDEMQKKEHDTFLLQSNDDFEDIFATKLKYFSDCKIGVSVPSRGETSDILNADGEKNDYDWLLTPPDTPLFPSLDDDPPHGILIQRGRPRSQPISISRSSTLEKTYKGNRSRGSPSPQRFIPSPRPGTGSSQQSRGRTSPVPSSSPTPSICNSSPSRKPSPPSLKSSTTGPRSSTPTPRRYSTGSSGTGASLSVRGSSPVQSSRGISSSPKISAWQSNIPGFSTEVPPNLRTSAADRPASYVRGSSPASRNGRDMSLKGKLSMSPTDHKSITQGRLSSHSKGSVVSCGDDDAESLQSIPLSTSDFSMPRRVGAQSNNKALTYSRKPNKIVSSSSAPKRSFDYAMRHMDQRKTPQNMFRPLLSSVPTTTLYTGKPIAAHEAMMSMNSSIATSSTTSSDQASGLAPDMEGSGHAHHDIFSQYEDKLDTDVVEEVFVLDNVNRIPSDAGIEIYDSSLKVQQEIIDEDSINATEHAADKDLCFHGCDRTLGANSKVISGISDMEGNGPENMTLCSECGFEYPFRENALNDVSLCLECSKKKSNLQVYVPEKTVTDIPPGTALNQPDKHHPLTVQEEKPSVSACLNLTSKSELRGFQCEDNVTISEPSFEAQSNSSADNSFTRSLVAEGDRKQLSPGPQEVCHRSIASSQPEIEDRDQFLQSSDTSSSYFNDSEADGISILLKRSNSSNKGPIYQGRIFKASSIPCDDPSYARESGSFTRSSMGLGSTSASSSVDLSSGRQIETRIQRQLSGKKIEIESYRLKRTGSHSSETSNHVYQTSCHSINTHEDEFEACAGNAYSMEEEISSLQGQFHTSGSTEIHAMIGSDSRTDSFKEANLEGDQRSMLMAATSSENPACNLLSGGISVISNVENLATFEHGEAIEKIPLMTAEIVLISELQSGEEHSSLETCSDAAKAMEASTHRHRSLDSVSEIENEFDQESSHGSENEYGSANLDSIISEGHKHSVPDLLEKREAKSVEEADPSNNAHGISESTVLIQGQSGNYARSLTLEEATDTILFCRSIVQNIVDQAATLAIEKEKPPQSEPCRPILAKTNPQSKETRGRAPNNKRGPKSHKQKQKQTQTEDAKPPLGKLENDENIEQPFPRNVGLPSKPDSARPPKLESKCNCAIM
uniref:Uncharacterized protein n=1 Tax=Kalanchoe fedtschenkoi TaxID=63787 RepID=A0A7N0ZSV4_KALFE